MTEAEIIKLFVDKGFKYVADDDENIIWFALDTNNIHVFRYPPYNVHLHINSKSFYRHCELGAFPARSSEAIEFIEKIKTIIKIYGK